MNRHGILPGIIALCIVGTSQSVFAEDTTRNAWSGILHQGLMLYQQGDYTNTFSLVEEAALQNPPGPEVHRCLVLMRKAFLRKHGLTAPVNEWPSSAQKEIDALESVREKTLGQLVVLAVLKYRRSRNSEAALPSEALLDRVIESGSPWRDWALWEKARILSEVAWVPTEEWGVVYYGDPGRRRIGCLDDQPVYTIPARAAEDVLRRDPDTYMGDAMRLQLYLYRLTVVRQAFSTLARNEWFTREQTPTFPLRDEQMTLVRDIEGKLKALSETFPADVLSLATAEANLDEFLWQEVGSPARVIPAYLKQLVKVYGEDVLSTPVTKWLAELPPVRAVQYKVYSPSE